jgi:NitT/TauT family transport system substrate-binding protein
LLLLNKKSFLTFTMLIALLLFISACGSSESANSGDSNGGSSDSAANKSEKEELPVINMVTFKPPSLGAFLTPIIEDQELDKKNGIDVQFTERPPSAYNTEFASGQYKVGGSAALLSEGLRMNRGVKVSYLFNVFDYWGTVVTADENIQTVKDLEGKNMAAAKSTTNYAMFQYFAQKAGADLSKINVLNAAPAALVTYAEADRADAVQMWQPAHSVLINNSPGKFHEMDFGLDKWEEYTGTQNKPYLGIAAHQDWIKAHKELIPKLYKTYLDAANWVRENPAESADLIASKIPGGKAKVIQGLIENDDLLGMNIKPAAQMEESIKAVFKAGLESNYFEEMPDDSVIYQESLE